MHFIYSFIIFYPDYGCGISEDYTKPEEPWRGSESVAGHHHIFAHSHLFHIPSKHLHLGKKVKLSILKSDLIDRHLETPSCPDCLGVGGLLIVAAVFIFFSSSESGTRCRLDTLPWGNILAKLSECEENFIRHYIKCSKSKSTDPSMKTLSKHIKVLF